MAKSGAEKKYISGLAALKVVVVAIKKIGLQSEKIMEEIYQAGRTLCPKDTLRKECGFKKDRQNTGQMKSRFSTLFAARHFRNEYLSHTQRFDVSIYDTNV